MSPTQRSLKELRARGYTAQVVERWNSFAKIRQDLFGIVDLVAIKSDMNGVLGIQATSTGNMGARIQKAQANETLNIWKQAGNRFVVWGWALRGERGKRKKYELREVEL